MSDNLSETDIPEEPQSPSGKPNTASPAKRQIKIGSQREEELINADVPSILGEAAEGEAAVDPTSPSSSSTSAEQQSMAPPASKRGLPPSTTTSLDRDSLRAAASFPPPRLRRDSGDLQKEIADALAGVSIDDLLSGKVGPTKGDEPKIDERYEATVLKLYGDHVFFSLPGNYEGLAALKQFDQAPTAGQQMEVIVRRFNGEDGLYELSVPGQAVSVADWSDIEEGTLVDVVVTGHNSGGLECEVNNIRGFIPISQVSQYRVEDLEQFLNEKFTCVVTEANPDRKNLVLSRRAVLEREESENREKMLASLEVGQEHEGVVRSLRDFGAFVDIGGIDGLVHISKMSWDRVRHPSDVLEEGQRIKVKVESIDETTGKIGLSYRDTLVHPWTGAEQKYVAQAIVKGTVSKVMDFGAFVRLEAGVEGLVHISELAHHRVSRVDTVVREGDQVEVKILSIDPENQRMSLSMKAIQAVPVAAQKSKEQEEEPLRAKATKSSGGPLQGGTNSRSGGDQFGLNW